MTSTQKRNTVHIFLKEFVKKKKKKTDRKAALLRERSALLQGWMREDGIQNVDEWGDGQVRSFH